MSEKEYDHINPDHYRNYPIEVIDMMSAIWGKRLPLLFAK